MRSTARTPTLLRLAALAVLTACVLVVAVRPAPASAASLVLTFIEGTAEAPFSLEQPLDPALTVGEGPDQQLRLVTPITRDLPFTGVARSVPLDLGRPALEKEFLSLSWGADKPRGTNFFISYSVDGGAWLPAIGGSGFDIPSGTHGTTIAYGVSLTSGDPEESPALNDIVIEYARWSGRPTVPPDGGGGTSHKPQPDDKPGSGVYTYPDAGDGAASGGAGGGAGGGSSGSGTGSGGGSGTGHGEGSGAGSGSSAAAATSAVSEAAAVQPAAVPSPPTSSTSGTPQAVSGLPVDSQQAVTGVVFEPAGNALAAEPSGAPAAAGAPSRLPIGPVALVIVSLVAMFFVPWLIAAARLRRITGYDFERARLSGPFWPLGR